MYANGIPDAVNQTKLISEEFGVQHHMIIWLFIFLWCLIVTNPSNENGEIIITLAKWKWNLKKQ